MSKFVHISDEISPVTKYPIDINWATYTQLWDRVTQSKKSLSLENKIISREVTNPHNAFIIN